MSQMGKLRLKEVAATCTQDECPCKRMAVEPCWSSLRPLLSPVSGLGWLGTPGTFIAWPQSRLQPWSILSLIHLQEVRGETFGGVARSHCRGQKARAQLARNVKLCFPGLYGPRTVPGWRLLWGSPGHNVPSVPTWTPWGRLRAEKKGQGCHAGACPL